MADESVEVNEDTRCWLPHSTLKDDDGNPIYLGGIGFECNEPGAVFQDPGSDTPPPNGEENPQGLGAPDPPSPTEETPSEPPAPYESSGDSPAEDYYRPVNPMPDYDVASNWFPNVPLDQLNDALQGVIHNEPQAGLPHRDFGLDDRKPLDTVIDPVIIFTGQYSLTVTDIEIPSRGFPLQLNRVYRSGPVYFGPWGYNWDHNYNVYLRELSDGGAAIWTGDLSEEVYKPGPDASFESPVGVFRKLERQAAILLTPDRYVLSDPGGAQQIFERQDGWPRPDRIPLVRIEDRHGNAHDLSYDAEGRLERIEDHAGRFIQFTYGDCGLLEQVSDHTGRVWRYFHDPETEHLVAVTTPPAAEYPEGLTTCYEYDRFRQHPALLHNLTRVIDPAGKVVVENRYGDNPGTYDFGRVIYQEFGGFEATFHATRLQYVPRTPAAINIPALRVEVVDPGVLHVYTFNYRGDLLDERFRLVLDGSYRLVARVFRYDKQGSLIEARQPNGLGVIAEYDSEHTDPRARGNLLRLNLSAPPSKPAPGREIARYTYESHYQQLKSIRDEDGQVTTFVYDYEETPVNQGNVIRIEYPSVTMPDQSIQDAREQFSYNAFGDLIERRSAENHRFTYEYYDAGADVGYLKQIVAGAGAENESQEFSYDQYGNLSAVSGALGSVKEYEYNALGQLILLRQPLVDGKQGEIRYHYGRDGRLKCLDTPRGNYQDSVITEPYIRHEFEFDVLGHVRSAVYGANTASPRQWHIKRTAEGFPLEVTDPLNRVTRLEYDERDLPLRQTLFAGTPKAGSVRFVYDRNGNLIQDIDYAGRKTEYSYDAWDRPLKTELPGAEGERTRIHCFYGSRDDIERIEVVGVPKPGLAPVLLEELDQQFDELGRLLRQGQSALSDVFWYDRDSCLVQVVDERNNAVSITCDALGRICNLTDALGNQVTYTFDKQGNLVEVDESEIVPGSATPETYHSTLGYDERNRLTSVTDSLGNAVTAEYEDRNLLVAATNPLGSRSEYEYDPEGLIVLARSFTGGPLLPVVHRWQRDRGGRVSLYIDPEDKKTQYDYDAEDRWSKIVLPDGSMQQLIFDASGQLEKEIAPSGTNIEYSYGADGLVERLHFIAGPGLSGLPDLVYNRDGLGRPVQLTQGTVTLNLQYDLLGRLTSETMGNSTANWVYDDVNGLGDLIYPDGRMDRYQLDALGRITTITLQQLAATPLTSNTLLPGTLLASYDYVGPQRMQRRVLGNGCETIFSYDQGRRLTGIEHKASSGMIAQVQYVYDAGGRRRVMCAQPAPGTSALFAFDTLSRLVEVSDGIAAPAPPANASQADADTYLLALGSPAAERTYAFNLNHADARKQSILTESQGTTTDDYLLNDLHQITQRTHTTPSLTSTHPFTYDPDGRRVGDDRYLYSYDAMGRLIEVRDKTNMTLLLHQEFDPLGRVMLRAAEGGNPERIRYLGDLSIQDDTNTGTALRQRSFGIQADELVAQSEGVERWCHQDARLSLLCVSDSAGVPLERYSYSPFGLPSIWAADGVTLLNVSNIGLTPIFGGHRYLGLNGLYDARARIYDADTGAFLQRDPFSYLDSANPYVYVIHNPVDFVDPTGEFVPLIIIVGVIAGALFGGGYSVYDSYHHPERYEGCGILRSFGYTVGGALWGGLAGYAAIAAGGLGALGTGGAVSGAGATGSGILTSSLGSVLRGLGAVGGAFAARIGGPRLESIITTSLPRTLTNIEAGLGHIVRGPWRPFGNKLTLLRKSLTNPRVRYGFKHLFQEPRIGPYQGEKVLRKGYNAVSSQYWRLNPGRRAAGNSLQHLWVQHKTRVPTWLQGTRVELCFERFKNAGFNLVEAPKSYNSWMGGRLARELGFRIPVASLLGGTGYGSYKGTLSFLEYNSGDPTLAGGTPVNAGVGGAYPFTLTPSGGTSITQPFGSASGLSTIPLLPDMMSPESTPPGGGALTNK